MINLLQFAAASVQQDPNDASKFLIVPQASTPNIQTVQVQQATNPVVGTISPSNQVNVPSPSNVMVHSHWQTPKIGTEKLTMEFMPI